ncbi:MAG TPA: hypothetical protein VJT73_15925 [Polyangiaceae bacterium]|nr:hypothetical protein [Polyangiaceae bacterium]
MRPRLMTPSLAMLAMVVTLPLACGSDPPPPAAETTGSACAVATDCYPGVDGATLMGGAAVCMDRVAGGYCTHVCAADTDCCALPGECKTAHPQVCAPFESTGMKFCFLSCEKADVTASGVAGDAAFCGTFAHVGFSCRSTGGGSENRKVCVP